MAKLPPGALCEGKDRMLSLHIAPDRKTAENLPLWQGQWTGLCDLYRSHCYELPFTREQFAALPDKRRKAVKDVGGVIPARLREGRRLKEAVLSRDFISLDIDNAPLDFIDRYRQFINRAAIIHSTASSTPDLPRYRVLIPLLETLRGDKRQNIAQKYEVAARQAIEALDLTIDLDTDKVSITCCQLMYWPACCKGERPVLEFIGGNFLDAARDLPLMVEAARRRKASSQPGIPQTPAPSLQAQTEDEGARLDAALADLFGDGQTEGTLLAQSEPLNDFEVLPDDTQSADPCPLIGEDGIPHPEVTEDTDLIALIDKLYPPPAPTPTPTPSKTPPNAPLVEVLENAGGLLLLYQPDSSTVVYKGYIAYYDFGNNESDINRIIKILEAKRGKAWGVENPAPPPLRGREDVDTLLSDVLSETSEHFQCVKGEQLGLFDTAQSTAQKVLRPDTFIQLCERMHPSPEVMKKNILGSIDQWASDVGSTETLFLKACFVIGLLTDDKEFYPEVEKRFAQRTGAILYSNMGRQVTCPDKGTSD